MLTKKSLLEFFEKDEEYERCAQIRDTFKDSDRIITVPVINPDGSCDRVIVTVPFSQVNRTLAG